MGMDVYRLLLAFSVILIHFCTYSTGGGLKNVHINSSQYFVGWMLFALVIPAVNCYALLSGYLSYGHRHTLKKPLTFYFELLFYSVTIMLVCKLFVQLSLKEQLIAFVPLCSGNWWYINVFILVSILMPALDYLVTHSDPAKFKMTIILLVGLICGSNTICLQKDLWFLDNGYTAFWVAFLYVLGAGIRKYEIPSKMSHAKWGICWATGVLLTGVSRFIIENITTIWFGNSVGGGLLFNYLSITVLLSAVSSLCFFATCDSKKSNKFLFFLAKGSFASYIIHVHPLFQSRFIQGRFLGYGEGHTLLETFKMLAIAGGIVVACSIIDRIRMWLFEFVGNTINKLKGKRVTVINKM